MTASEITLAQQRIAARHAARQDGSNHSLPTSRLPTSIHQFFEIIISGWSQIRRQEGTQPYFRVGQFDSEQLDEELFGLLKTQVADGLKYFGSRLQEEWAAEIGLGLRALLFKLTVWDNNATYGAALQNLQYADARLERGILIAPSKWQKFLYGLTTVGGRYAWTRWEEWLIDRNGEFGSSKMLKIQSKLHEVLGTIHFTAAFMSFLVFLVNGRYRTLLDRILKIRLVPQNSQVSRQISFEHLNRQLVWHAFTEFLLFFLPLVGVNRWRRWFKRGWKKTKYMVMNGVEIDEDSRSGELSFLPERACAICYQDQNLTSTSEASMIAAESSGTVGLAQKDITNPYESIPCGCVYCFVCLASRLKLEEGDGWTCLRCGKEIKECKPWNGDVITEMAKPTITTKSVIFSESEKEKIDHKDL